MWSYQISEVAHVLDCDIVVIEFEIQSRNFRINTVRKGMKLLILLSYGLKSTTIDLRQEWLWHLITQEGWYAIKQKMFAMHFYYEIISDVFLM